jgi:hypothetical protein
MLYREVILLESEMAVLEVETQINNKTFQIAFNKKVLSSKNNPLKKICSKMVLVMIFKRFRDLTTYY